MSKKSKNLTHSLIDNVSGKLLNLRLSDKHLISETGKPDKLRATEKTFADAADAQKNFFKKEWEALKKGFVLNNENAKIGEPVLHKFIGGGNTGCLSFEQTPNGIYVCKNTQDNESGEFTDYLILIDNLGAVSHQIAMPFPLAWNISYREETNSLLLIIDHFIFEYDIEKQTFRNIAGEARSMTSFLSVSKYKTAFATNGKTHIVDNQNNDLLTTNYDFEMINGTVPLDGKLSKDGQLLAFHNKAGEVQIIDTSNGELIKNIVGNFQYVQEMEFAENNNLLVIQEQHGTWRMRYFDLTSNSEIEFKGLEIPEYTKEVRNFCFNADYSKLVLVQRTTAYVYDFNAKTFLHSFDLQHVVKTCNIKFVGEKLGVRSDYGCFSIYNV